MAWFWKLNLIDLFTFYLWVAFLISTWLRVQQYRDILRLVRAAPGRWPRLLKLIKEHWSVFLTWTTILPAGLALGLSLVHTLASYLVWPHAELTVERLAGFWQAALAVALLGAAMTGVDLYATFNVGEFDRKLMQRYFDQAEYWLRSWTAPVVRVFTLGYVNPRTMVAVEVRKALVNASELINSTLWWVSVQVGLRVCFGLALWLAYAWMPT